MVLVAVEMEVGLISIRVVVTVVLVLVLNEIVVVRFYENLNSICLLFIDQKSG